MRKIAFAVARDPVVVDVAVADRSVVVVRNEVVAQSVAAVQSADRAVRVDLAKTDQDRKDRAKKDRAKTHIGTGIREGIKVLPRAEHVLPATIKPVVVVAVAAVVDSSAEM